MKIILSERAEANLLTQLQYLLDQGAGDIARELEQDVLYFLHKTLAMMPTMGHQTPRSNLLEMRIPNTNLAVWYKFTRSTLTVVALWHLSQDRSSIKKHS